MKRVCLCLMLLFLSLSVKGQTQTLLYYETHPFSVSVSTGLPFWGTMLHPPGDPDNSLTLEGQRVGLGYKTHCPFNLNVAFQYHFAKRWEAAVALNANGLIFSEYRYPPKGELENYGTIYDWKATPENLGLRTSKAFSATLLVRFYWLARKDSFQMYSALGAGMFFGAQRVQPVPQLTPVGIRFGKKRWFGTAELALGTMGTGLLFGVGYRF